MEKIVLALRSSCGVNNMGHRSIAVLHVSVCVCVSVYYTFNYVCESVVAFFLHFIVRSLSVRFFVVAAALGSVRYFKLHTHTSQCDSNDFAKLVVACIVIFYILLSFFRNKIQYDFHEASTYTRIHLLRSIWLRVRVCVLLLI